MDWPIERDPIYYCWLWQDGLNDSGYGIFWAKGKRKAAHRAVYEEEMGDIPEGLVLDHWCRRRNCVNPMHLEPVSGRVNERRKVWRVRVRLKECMRGHDLWKHGRLTPEGGKVCRLCE